jgi:putative transcription antitermination factor YqgF
VTSSLPRAVRMALDVGSVRIGVARSDPDGIMAVPLLTIAQSETAVSEALEVATEFHAAVIYVGKPVNLKGDSTASTQMAIEFAHSLESSVQENALDIEVRLIDERLSTVSANSAMQSAGRSQRQSRQVIDQAAAVVILEHALASEKSAGSFVGTPVTRAT